MTADPAETDASAAGSGEFVQSFARGLAVIRAFDAAHPELTLSEVAQRAGASRAAARRFLLTLEALGYVRSTDRAFALTPRVLELGYSYLSALSMPEIAQPHLERLSHELDQSSSLAVLDGADVVYVARVPTRRIMNVSITIGSRFPAHATSLGRVLLAGLPPVEREEVLRASGELRAFTARTTTDVDALLVELALVAERGWALVEGELDEGLRSIAAPVHDRRGRVVAAVNVSMSDRGSAGRDAQVVDALQRAVAAIDADLAAG